MQNLIEPLPGIASACYKASRKIKTLILSRQIGSGIARSLTGGTPSGIWLESRLTRSKDERRRREEWLERLDPQQVYPLTHYSMTVTITRLYRLKAGTPLSVTRRMMW